MFQEMFSFFSVLVFLVCLTQLVREESSALVHLAEESPSAPTNAEAEMASGKKLRYPELSIFAIERIPGIAGDQQNILFLYQNAFCKVCEMESLLEENCILQIPSIGEKSLERLQYYLEFSYEDCRGF